MSLKIYQSTQYRHTHEREQFEDLCNICIDCFSETKEKNLLFANINMDGVPLDALLVKPDAIIMIEFKDYSGSVVASENGEWKCGDGTIVEGGAQSNPFVQTQKNKYRVMDWFKNYFYSENVNLGHIAGVVVFKNNMEVDDRLISGRSKSWFSVTDMDHIGSKLKNITSPETNFTDDDLEELPQILNFDEIFNLVYPNIDETIEELEKITNTTAQDAFSVQPTELYNAGNDPGIGIWGGIYHGGWNEDEGLPDGVGTFVKDDFTYVGVWHLGEPGVNEEFDVNSKSQDDSVNYKGTLTNDLKPNKGKLTRNFSNYNIIAEYDGVFEGWYLKKGKYIKNNKLHKEGTFDHISLHNGKVMLNLVEGRKREENFDLGNGCQFTGLVDIKTKLPEDEEGELVDAKGNRFVGPFKNGKKNGRFKVYISGEQEPIQCDYNDDVEL